MEIGLPVGVPRRKGILLAAGLAVGLSWFALSPPTEARAASSGGVQLAVTVEGQPLGRGDIVLDAGSVARVVVGVQNLTRSDIPVDSVRLSGTVLGLTFFDYDTRVRTTVPAQGSANWTVDLDIRDLAGRATGLVPVEVAIRDTDLHTVARATGSASVRGSVFSVYGLFGLGLLVLMGLLWAVALLPLGRHAAPATWWQRGLRFLPAGVAVGLFGVFALSATRLLSPTGTVDGVLTVVAAAACFAIGAALPWLEGARRGG
ncbi:conserved membrane hypothetical protein [Frankia canadensis]|uniref:Uncharacterized protein n=1 Tax=Frankia canadensis TaxID=1836972 RepID=A0A2I2KZU2_9ACTN|nr:hypothetical protein [Frankia canadensis]SNQ51183.1 conserved membrane hypothetical protein [Frankia canadensis]SOU58473.1 conserved membrane hypothetical protein [Frankia canadensis]